MCIQVVECPDGSLAGNAPVSGWDAGSSGGVWARRSGPGFVLWFWFVRHPVLLLGRNNSKHSRLVGIGEIARSLFYSFSMTVLDDTVLDGSLHRGFPGTDQELPVDGLGVDAA